MKKKYLNIALLILVLVIYGGVFSKVFGKKETQLNEPYYPTTFSSQISNFDIKRENFDIGSIENDPFKINKKRKPLRTSQIKKPSFSSKKTILQKPWPKITYHGFVKNNLNSTKLALVKVGNKFYRKREQEDIGDIRIVKAYNDSIVFTKNNETKTIKKVNE